MRSDPGGLPVVPATFLPLRNGQLHITGRVASIRCKRHAHEASGLIVFFYASEEMPKRAREQITKDGKEKRPSAIARGPFFCDCSRIWWWYSYKTVTCNLY